MIGTLLRQHYRITKKLGEGGFGETYIAQDLDLPGNPECVLKRLKASSNAAIIERLFQEEAITLQKLGEHDQIPRLLAYFEEKGEFYLVQSLIVGHGLDQENTPGKQLSESYVIALLKSVLKPLCFVHQNQVVHRDIKPANLIRRKQDGKIVLIDFGAVKEIAATRVVTGGHTQLTVAIGTPGYMPSEQSRGRPRFSSDIYGLGMVGIQALTGKMPEYLQEDMDTGEIIWRNQINAGVNEQLLAILDCMVRYDFRQRYSSAQEALEIVQQLASNSTSSTTYQLNTTPQQLLPTVPGIPSNFPIDQHLPADSKVNSTKPRKLLGQLILIKIIGKLITFIFLFVFKNKFYFYYEGVAFAVVITIMGIFLLLQGTLLSDYSDIIDYFISLE